MPREIATAILPKCASAIAEACADEAGRFALQCVRLVVRDGQSRIEATNGRLLVHATYRDDTFDEKGDKHRTSGEGEVLIDGVDFGAALKQGGLNAKDRAAHVVLLDDGSVRFELPRWTVTLPPRAHGKFPDTREVVPSPSSCRGAKPGEPLGWGVGVVGTALTIAQQVVGDAVAAARCYPNGVDGALRIDIEGRYGTAVAVFMPATLEERAPMASEPVAVPA